MAVYKHNQKMTNDLLIKLLKVIIICLLYNAYNMCVAWYVNYSREPRKVFKLWKVSVAHAWYDMWIGYYADTKNRVHYICIYTMLIWWPFSKTLEERLEIERLAEIRIATERLRQPNNVDLQIQHQMQATKVKKLHEKVIKKWTRKYRTK